jgi:signal transduction histidine kinase
MSLRRRFVLVLGTYGVALAAVVGFAGWSISTSALEEQLDQRLTDVAGAAIATGLYDATSYLNWLNPSDSTLGGYTQARARLEALLPFVAEAFIFDATDLRLRVSTRTKDENGVWEFRPIGTQLYELENYKEEIVEAVRGGTSTTRHFPYPAPDGPPNKYGFVRIAPGQGAILAVRVPADFLAPVARLEAALLWSSAAALVVAALLGALLAAGIAAPIEDLSRAAARIQRGRLDRPVPTDDGEDELARLARAMERMRTAILERDERLRVMLAQVAHEIRNPLGGLELFASAAATAEDPRERRRLIERLRAEVAALNGIIDDFLTFARPLNPNYEPVDLRPAIDEAADLARADVAVGGSLDVDLPEQPLFARADRDQVKRAVLNLVRNAVQAGSNVRIWAKEEGGDVMIAVMDDGPGVSPSVRERVFEPFVTDKEKGAGLGLAIVKKVAEAHGGRVELRQASDPTYGSGAEFRLYLTGSPAPSPLVAPTPV